MKEKWNEIMFCHLENDWNKKFNFFLSRIFENKISFFLTILLSKPQKKLNQEVVSVLEYVIQKFHDILLNNFLIFHWFIIGENSKPECEFLEMHFNCQILSYQKSVHFLWNSRINLYERLFFLSVFRYELFSLYKFVKFHSFFQY
jgi:hypothetical protein